MLPKMAITDFGAPKVIGGQYDVLATDVYRRGIGQQNFEMGAVVTLRQRPDDGVRRRVPRRAPDRASVGLGAEHGRHGETASAAAMARMMVYTNVGARTLHGGARAVAGATDAGVAAAVTGRDAGPRDRRSSGVSKEER
jgi:hypothetical protein